MVAYACFDYPNKRKGMVYAENHPPAESSENEFPELDSVVTVENCWYYLSLLERFVRMTKDMEEDILKLYLVRAEYRYVQWIEGYKKRFPYDYETTELFSIPPLGRSKKENVQGNVNMKNEIDELLWDRCRLFLASAPAKSSSLQR